MTDLSPEAQKAIEQVEKLLRLAGKNPNQNEAAAASAKAMEILARYNLDMSVVEQNSGASSGKREDTKFKGGLYHFQRDLWQAVAKLNFCFYWNQYTWDPDKKSNSPRQRRLRARGLSDGGGYRFEHRLVGRSVNVAATRVMSDYVLQTIERLARERYPEPSQLFSRSAVSYREGMAEAVIDKVFERRKQIMKEEERKARAAKKRAEEAARAGVSTATTLTIADMQKSEHDANVDFIYGDGTSARWAAEEAESARRAAEEQAAYTAWAKAHPEEARAKEEAARKARRRQGYGRASYRDTKERDNSAYYAGIDKGKEIGIEPQADSARWSGGMLR